MARKPAPKRISLSGGLPPRKLKKERSKKRSTRKSPPRAALTDSQKGLALSYLPMARALAKPLKRAWPVESDEFDSAACFALVEAAQSYDPARQVKFATFARYRIWGALRDVQRALITSGWRGHLDRAPKLTSLTCNTEEVGSVMGAVPDTPVGQEFDAIETVEHWLRRLPRRNADACREIYIKGKTQCAAAVTLGCSKSRLSYLHKESIELLNDTWGMQLRAAANIKD